MRRFAALGIVGVGTAVLIPGAARAGSGSRLPSPAVASPATSLVATQPRTGVIDVRRGAKTQRYAVPAGCLPGAITAKAIVLAGCGPAVLVLSTGRVRPVPLSDGYNGFAAVAIGAEWMEGDVGLSNIGDGTRSVSTNAIVNWHTGRFVALDQNDPYGARRYPDLDRVHPGRRLCRPIRRLSARPPAASNTRFAVVQRVGDWVLQTGSRGPRLQRCGSDRIVVWRGDFVAALGHHHAAAFDLAHPSRGVEVRALQTGKTHRVRTPHAVELSVAFSRDALIVSSRVGLAWTKKSYQRFS
jgi:hypothetical protein